MGTKIFSYGMIITLLGLLIMAGGTWFGLALQGSSPVLAGVAAIVVLLGGGTAIFMAAKAKVCTSDFRKWMTVEIVCLLAMFAILGFATLPTATTVNFIRNYSALSEAAATDVAGIDSMLTSFDSNETERMNGTFRGLENYLRLGNRNCSPALAAYIENTLGSSPRHFSQNIINNNRGTVQAKIEDLRLDNRMYRNTFNKAIDKLQGVADSRMPLNYATFEHRLDTVSAQIGLVLTDISASLDLPVVYAGQGQQYTVRPTEPVVYSFTPGAYATALEQVKVFNWTSLLMAVVCAVVAMFYYLISYRALRKGVDKGSKASDNFGIPL